MNKLEQIVTSAESRKVLEEFVHTFANTIKEINVLKQKIDYIAHDNRLLRKRLFGSSSEKLVMEEPAIQDDLNLFNEFELVSQQAEPEDIEPLEMPTEGPVTKRKSGRKALPAHLPRTVICHDLTADEKRCACGSEMGCIGAQVSEELEDEQFRHPSDNPTIGILLCESRSKIVAEYALRQINAPIGVSEYTLSKALPKELKSSLPTVEQIELELNESKSD